MRWFFESTCDAAHKWLSVRPRALRRGRLCPKMSKATRRRLLYSNTSPESTTSTAEVALSCQSCRATASRFVYCAFFDSCIVHSFLLFLWVPNQIMGCRCVWEETDISVPSSNNGDNTSSEVSTKISFSYASRLICTRDITHVLYG